MLTQLGDLQNANKAVKWRPEVDPMSDQNPKETKRGGGQYMGVGIPIGIALGIIIGMLMDNLAVGVAIGAGLGVVLGAVLNAQQR
jgi:hypothetical protein